MAHLTIALPLLVCSSTAQVVETNTPAPGLSELQTNVAQLLRACSQIQDQLRAAREAIEQARREGRETAARDAQTFSKGLELVQETASAQRAKDFEQMQRSNTQLVIIAAGFGALALLAMLFLSYFQWRMIRGVARSLTAVPNTLALSNGLAAESLGSAEQVQSRLLGAIAQVDERIHEFQRVLSNGSNGQTGGQIHATPTLANVATQSNDHGRVSSLLQEAQAMMNADHAEEALGRLDEALALDSNNAEALVKKGAALERLHKLNEAIECYDRAIAADSSMALAYLHKGGLCNRLERFKEALECYGKALLMQGQRGGQSGGSQGTVPKSEGQAK